MPSPKPPITGIGSKVFKIDLKLDSSGRPVSGSLTISGKITALGINTVQDLIVGQVTAFGFGDSGASEAALRIFEFLFDVQSGALQSYFAPTVGVILNVGAYVAVHSVKLVLPDSGESVMKVAWMLSNSRMTFARDGSHPIGWSRWS